jgi:phosphoribosylglycinamide formyltransferase-1
LSLYKLAVLISGSGTNLQAIIDAIADGTIHNAKIALVISNREDAFGLERAKKAGIPNIFIANNKKDTLLKILESHGIDAVVLAGYLSLLSEDVVNTYTGKIINIHPSLIPKYCGKGFYGLKVHQAVIDAGEKFTGATLHFVDSEYDTGKILLQRIVPVLPEDTAESLQKRVLKTEHIILIEGINILTKNDKNKGI